MPLWQMNFELVSVDLLSLKLDANSSCHCREMEIQAMKQSRVFGSKGRLDNSARIKVSATRRLSPVMC